MHKSCFVYPFPKMKELMLFYLTLIFTIEDSYGFVPSYKFLEKSHRTNKTMQRNDSLKRLLGEKKPQPLMLTELKQVLQGIAGERIPLGITDFQALIEQNALLVDKTNFIADFMTDSFAHVMITRPQGFGKTFAHSMLYHFLNIRANSSGLFNGTNIAKDQDVCKAHQNQHPVIRISFGGLESATTWEEAQNLFQSTFSNMLLDHLYLITEKPKINDHPEDYRKKWFDQVLESRSLVFPTPTLTIQILSRHLYNHFKKRVVILIDDYDSPIHAAYRNGYYTQMRDFYRPLLHYALTGNPFVHKSLILGVSRVGKNDIFLGINHLECYTTMKTQYSSYFGFDRSETLKLVSGYNTGLVDRMVQKYGGYRFGDLSLLNPYSVTQCLTHNGNLMSHWMDSSRKKHFGKLMNSCGFVPVLESEILLQKLLIDHTYDEKLSYSAVIEKDLNAFWTLIIDFGYMTIAEKEQKGQGRFNCQLEIPNEELFEVFHEFIDHYHVNNEVLTYMEWKKLIVARNRSAALDNLKLYFDNVLREYFAVDHVENPLAQLESLSKAVAEGLRKDYLGLEISVNSFLPRNTLIGFSGGPRDIPLAIICGYYEKPPKCSMENIFKALKYSCASLIVRPFIFLRKGQIKIGSKRVVYGIFDFSLFFRACRSLKLKEIVEKFVFD